MKWVKRIVLGLFVLLLLFVGIRFFQYKSAMDRIADQLPGTSSVIQTTLGPVEYLKQGTSNKYVLLIHGTPGSYHTFMADVLVSAGFTVISPSRPGYFRTPLSSGETIAQQGQLYAALLDALNIESASIIGFSGGGPSALMFASQFPNRCDGLVVMATTGRNFDEPEQSAIQAMIMGSEFGRWEAYSALSGSFDEAKSETALSYLQTAFFPLNQVMTGEQNDFKLFASNWRVDLTAIECPSLIIHGTQDELIPFSEAEYINKGIANSTLIKKEAQDHFTVVFFEFDQNLQLAADFLNAELW